MKKIGRYDIIAELGRGAMGIVYRASDPTIGREVALKVLSLNASAEEGTNSPQQMFMREVRAAGRLAHPSIVTIHDAFDDKEDQTSCIVMELVPGVTLEKILESGQPLGMDHILSIIRQVAEGLDYAHRNQVIHRDLKPANILVTDDGRAKITDFGIAKVLAREGLARTIGIMGTPSFMSPEQVKGGDIDARTDIFSLGIIIFTLFAGRKPFLGNSAAVMFKIVYEEPPAPSTLNPQLTPAHDYLTKKCLAKDRNLRYSSAREFLDDLDDLQQGRPLRSQAAAPAVFPAAPPAPAVAPWRVEAPTVEAPAAMAPPPPPPLPPTPSAAPTAFGEFRTYPTAQPQESFTPPPGPLAPPPPVAAPPPVAPPPARRPVTPPTLGGTMVMNTPGFLAEDAPPTPPVSTRPPAPPPAPVEPPKPFAPPSMAPPPRTPTPVPARPPLTPPDPGGTMVMKSPALISRVPQTPPPRAVATPPAGPPAQPPKAVAPPPAAPVPARPPLTAPDPAGTMVMQHPGVATGPPAPPPPRVVAAPPPAPAQPPKPVAPPPARVQPPMAHPPSPPPSGPPVAPPPVPPVPSRAPAASTPAAFGATMIGKALPTSAPTPPRAAPVPPTPAPAPGIPGAPPPAAGPRTAPSAAPLHPAAPSAVPPPEPAAAPGPAPKSNLIPILVGGVVVVLLAAAGLVIWGIHRARMASSPPARVATQTPQPQPQPTPPSVAASTEAPPAPAAPAVEEPKPPESTAPGTVKKPIVRKPKPAVAPAPPSPEPTPPPVQSQPVAPAPKPTPPPPTPEEIAKAEAARLAKIPRIIQIDCNYGMKEATFVFSAGGRTLFEETLKGNKVKHGFLGIKGSYQGSFSHTITVPAGMSEVTVRVLARDGATDLTKDIKMLPVGGFIPTLAVDVDSDHLSLNWKSSSAASK